MHTKQEIDLYHVATQIVTSCYFCQFLPDLRCSSTKVIILSIISLFIYFFVFGQYSKELKGDAHPLLFL